MRGARRPSLVEEVREALLEELARPAVQRGARLPSETELADRFAVSRATVREAVRGLIDAGLLVRRHGAGTFVADAPRSPHALDTTVSYTAMIRDTGEVPGEILLAKRERVAEPEEARRLGVAAGARLTELERVRTAGARPVIYSRDRIPHPLLEGFADEQLESSLYVVLDWAGHRVQRAVAHLTARSAPAAIASHLRVPRGSALLGIEQVDYDRADRAVMLSDEWHVPDAFDLVVNRRGPSI